MNLISQWAAKLRSAFAEPVPPKGAPPLPPGFLKALADGPTAQTPAPVFFPAPAYQPSQAIIVPNSPAVSPAPAASPQAKEPNMSILSDLLKKKISFGQAAAEAESWGESLIKANPTATADVNAVVSSVKQAASNAVSYADTELAVYLTPATEATEVAADTMLAALTKGASTVANPLINAGIEQAADALKAVIDAAVVKAKAALATPTATAQPNPQLAS